MSAPNLTEAESYVRLAITIGRVPSVAASLPVVLAEYERRGVELGLLGDVRKAAEHLLMTQSVPEYGERDFHLALEQLVKALTAYNQWRRP